MPKGDDEELCGGTRGVTQAIKHSADGPEGVGRAGGSHTKQPSAEQALSAAMPSWEAPEPQQFLPKPQEKRELPLLFLCVTMAQLAVQRPV